MYNIKINGKSLLIGVFMEDLKRTPLHDIHKRNGGHIVPFAGWEMPVRFSSIKEEHIAVRTNAGIFDVSHMGEFIIHGPEAVKFVDMLITNSVGSLENYQICYSPMCNDKGGIVDDLLAYKFNESKIMLVVNASNIEKDFDWVVKKSADYDVAVENESANFAQIAIQGPNAEKILQKTVVSELGKIGFFHFRELTFNNGITAIVSRTGYTGEDGFEIYMASASAEKMWIDIMEAGKDSALLPIGLGARDTLRFEAKLMLYGNELDDATSPVEAGLKWAMDINKDFIGKDRALKEIENKPARALVGFEMEERAIPRHGYAIFAGDEEVGIVTSGTFAPFLEKYLGLGYVSRSHRKRGTQIEISIRGKNKKAVIVKTPFYKKQYKKD